MSVNVGVIGAGGMVHYHVPGFQKAGAEVVAIADINEAAAQTVAAQYNVPKTFGDPAKMLQSGEVDAVSVITPNKFHHPLCMAALQAGKHVFCEKPPALNAAQTQEMVDAAKKSGKTLMFDFNNRARPESYQMMAYIQDGTVGTINSAQAMWIRRCGIPGFGGWFTNRELSGGGPLIDLMHMLDLALYFMGYPKPEYVLGGTFDTHINDPAFKGPWGIPDVVGATNTVEAAAHGFIRFEGGQVLSFRNSWAEMNEREEVSVVFQGTKSGGRVRRLFGVDGLDDTATDDCTLFTMEQGMPVNRALVFQNDEAMGRLRAAENFIHALDGKEPPLNTPEEALKLMQIIDATYESAHTGKPIQIK
ncbi:MAG: Gfo/Idh/MocA family protein [Opitutales bacterium]